MTTGKNLCVVTGNLIVAKEVFTEGGAEKLLEPLRKALKEFVPDITTAKGRKEIASFAAKFSKSKTLVDGLGKGLKDEYSVLIKPIDVERKIFRDVCDMLRDDARKPLTLWEAEQERIVEEERQKVILNLDHEEALGIDDLFNRERAMAIKEAEMQKMEDERLGKERAEKALKDQVEYEARVKANAEAEAKERAEEALLFEQQEKEKLIDEAEKAKAQQLLDIEAEKVRVENARIEAEEKAEREKQEAIASFKRELEEKEQAERDRVKAEKVIADRKAANMNHRKAINNKVLKKLMFMDIGGLVISEQQAKDIIEDILKNPIPEISINYGG